MSTKLFALYGAFALILAAVGPGIGAVAAQEAGNAPLEVAVNQADDGSVTVEVTQNESGVENASVGVEALDNETYAGEGEYTTDENGTVGLPAPRERVTVNVTASVDNLTATTTATLTAANVTENETFGQRMSAFVHALQEVEASPLGPYVAAFAVENNPGNAPDHAGPPAFLFGDGDDSGPPWLGEEDETDDNETVDSETDDERGPPEHAGPPGDDERDEDDEGGPPEHAGPPDEKDDERGPPEDGEDDEDERGPPEDAGNGNGPPGN